MTKENPGTEIVADAAATLAAALALLGDSTGGDWKSTALAHAKTLYTWGKSQQKSYADSKDDGIQELHEMYESSLKN